MNAPLSTTQLRQAGVREWMIEALAAEVRPVGTALDGHLVSVGTPLKLVGTETTARCHFVARTGNGEVVTRKLARKLARQIVDYCIPRSRIAEAQASGSAEAVLALQQEARDLFTRVEYSGEGGEMLLYLLLESVLRLPQLLCKMPLKTNPAMHVHGADGIHGALLDDGRLSLYWGESKLHKSPSKAIDECFESLAPFVSDDGSGVTRRDLELLRDGLDLRDPQLVEALRRYLLDDTVESTRVEFRGAALIGFDLAKYPEPFASDGVTVEQAVAKAIERWYARIDQSLRSNVIERFTIEVFCIPFPSVDALRAEVRAALALSQ